MAYPGRDSLSLCTGQVATSKFLKNGNGQAMLGAQRETANGKAKGQAEFKTKGKIF